MLRIKLIKSKAGTRWQQNATVTALGLRKMNQIVEKDDNASIRGMIHHVRHMVSVEVVEGQVAKKTSIAKKSAKPAPAKAAVKEETKVETATVAADKPKAPAGPKKPAAKKPAATKKDSKE